MRLFPSPSDAGLIREKQDQAIAALDTLDIDAWLVFVREGGDSHTVQTIAGPEFVVQNAAMILTRSGRRIAILEPIDVQNGTGTHFDEIVNYQLDIGPSLREVWASIAPKKVALNYSRRQFTADGLTHGMYLRLKDALGDDLERAAVSSEDLMVNVRAVKSATEIERLTKACEITLQIIGEITEILKPGVTDTEIGDFVKRRSGELGAEEGEASIAVNGPGKNQKGPIGKTVEAGQVVLLDMGVCYKGYHSDLKRMWYIRDAAHPFPEILQKQWDACRESADHSLTLLKPGAWGYDVHHGAWEIVEKHGFARDAHSYGHQIGRQVHDTGVWLGEKDNLYRPADAKLSADMVVTVDPTINRVGISEPEGYSMGIEDIARVTPAGGELLHPIQKEVTVVDW